MTNNKKIVPAGSTSKQFVQKCIDENHQLINKIKQSQIKTNLRIEKYKNS